MTRFRRTPTADIFKEDALDDTSDIQSEYPPVAPEGIGEAQKNENR